jgi:AraC-like DNA-binding protein
MSRTSQSETFSTVEELEGTLQSAGYDVDYRQIGKGAFSSEVKTFVGADSVLASVGFNNHLQIGAQATQGFVGIILPNLGSGKAAMCGTALDDEGIVFFPPESEMEFVTSGRVKNETVLIPEAKFHAFVRALAPSQTWSFPKAVTVYQADPLRYAQMRQVISPVYRNGCLSAETVSSLLTTLVLWLIEASPESKSEQWTDGSAATIARRAQTFIENEYQNKIHLNDLCVHTGVGLRTLQRCFASYFQISPLEYIKIRRLNEVRRNLVKTDPSDCTVTSVAMKNGISHLGRFSVEYRTHFGESPSKTLAERGP